RIMVGLGLAMLALGAWSLLARLRRRLHEWPALHRAALLMAPAGFVAVIAGWATTEVGRQPFTVYNLMTTAESASPLAAPAVGASLVAFVLVYFIVFGFGTWYILRLMAKGVQAQESAPDGDEGPIRTAGIVPGPAERLRPRHRDPVPRVRARPRPQPGDQFGRAGVGRQRDLAGVRRRWPAGRVPAGLRGDHDRAVSAGDRDAAGAGVPRRGVRGAL